MARVRIGSILSKNAVRLQTFMCTDRILHPQSRQCEESGSGISPDRESHCGSASDPHPSKPFFDSIGQIATFCGSPRVVRTTPSCGSRMCFRLGRAEELRSCALIAFATRLLSTRQDDADVDRLFHRSCFLVSHDGHVSRSRHGHGPCAPGRRRQARRLCQRLAIRA